MNKPYNGYKNWNFWNVSLWMNNDEGFYHIALECLKDAKQSEHRKKGESVLDLATLMYIVRMDEEKTPDGAKWSKSAVKTALKSLND